MPQVCWLNQTPLVPQVNAGELALPALQSGHVRRMLAFCCVAINHLDRLSESVTCLLFSKPGNQKGRGR